MKKHFLLFALSTLLYSCSSCTSKTKEGINKVGDVTGQVVGTLAKGVYHGVQKAFDVKVDVSKTLIDNGLSIGKTTVTDSADVSNTLVVYVIFNKDYAGSLTAKAFDNKDLEMGRVALNIAGKKDEAKYFEFRFDKHTEIQSDSKLTLE